MTGIDFTKLSRSKPIVLAGPCMAESQQIMVQAAEFLSGLSEKLGFQLVFKASFDKANRTSIFSDRGPGVSKAAEWFHEIREKFSVPTVTDIHETSQVQDAAKFSDILQIPAFLCRQTDLLVAAVESKCAVNIKKGQFLAPEATSHIASKVREIAEQSGVPANFALTERGTSFGYGDLVVDMRSLKVMSECPAPVIFDITHSCQKPASSGSNTTSGGARSFAALLARSAVATGYVDGLFLEVHPDPSRAKSDSQVQLSFDQAEALLTQVIPMFKQTESFSAIDSKFM